MIVVDEFALWLGALGSVATAGAVWGGALHLRTARRQLDVVRRNAQTAFEDDLSREYRSIVAELPAPSFYTDQTVPLDDQTRRAFFRYFDLSNEQLFLGRHRRVSDATLEQWREGIVGNLRLPSFVAAWRDLVDHLPDDFFEELRPFVPISAEGTARAPWER